MKKGRPGFWLCALARPETAAQLEQVLIRETSTLGLRRRRLERTELVREVRRVALPEGGGEVAVKCAWYAGRLVTASPEFEDVRRLARERGEPVRRTFARAQAAAAALLQAQPPAPLGPAPASAPCPPPAGG
ncbi:MAG: hypothetical protein KatS3mg102_1376 [Planctomycetota bacterium]|nr:MAG: hypothetical protein KatS3mg102_1376 [Planctomycetota bacterium]